MPSSTSSASLLTRAISSGSEEEKPEDYEEEIELEIMPHNYEYTVNPGEAAEAKPLLGGSPTPRDRRYTVFFIFGFLGLACLLPWNFFITAKKYFDYKLRNTSLPSNVSYDDSAHATNYQVDFESFLSIVSNGCNCLFAAVTIMIAKTVNTKIRIICASIVILIIFTATAVLVEIDTDSWQDTFLISTLVMAAIMSAGQSVLISSVLGLSAIFPPIYSQSAMIGQAAGGTFTAVVSILTQVSGGSATSSAFIYFLIAIAVIVLTILAYIALHFLNYSKHHMMSQGRALKDMSENVSEESTNNCMRYWRIFKKIWLYFLSLTTVFLVSLSVFPSVCSLIKAENQDNAQWSDYFTPVTCFLLFNVGDFLGRLFTFVCKFPGNNRPKWFLVLTILRIAFIPLLMFCNAQPRNHLPVYLDSDIYPIVLILLLGLTNGYIGTLCMSFGPVHVEESEAEVAGIMLSIAMSIGLASGSGLSVLFVQLL